MTARKDTKTATPSRIKGDTKGSKDDGTTASTLLSDQPTGDQRVPFDELYLTLSTEDIDIPGTWKGLAIAAISDLRRYAGDESPERRLVSARGYEALAELIAESGQ